MRPPAIRRLHADCLLADAGLPWTESRHTARGAAHHKTYWVDITLFEISTAPMMISANHADRRADQPLSVVFSMTSMRCWGGVNAPSAARGNMLRKPFAPINAATHRYTQTRTIMTVRIVENVSHRDTEGPNTSNDCDAAYEMLSASSPWWAAHITPVAGMDSI